MPPKNWGAKKIGEVHFRFSGKNGGRIGCGPPHHEHRVPNNDSEPPGASTPRLSLSSAPSCASHTRRPCPCLAPRLRFALCPALPCASPCPATPALAGLLACACPECHYSLALSAMTRAHVNPLRLCPCQRTLPCWSSLCPVPCLCPASTLPLPLPLPPAPVPCLLTLHRLCPCL
jgi:hypothetical protein